MADPNVPPRRVSMSYILGLTNKPFKDPLPPPPPRPPQPNALVQMVNDYHQLCGRDVLTNVRSLHLAAWLNGRLVMVARADLRAQVGKDSPQPILRKFRQ